MPTVPCPPTALCCATLLRTLQVISAELDYKLACSGYNVRQFVVEVLSTMIDGGRQVPGRGRAGSWALRADCLHAPLTACGRVQHVCACVLLPRTA